jgi:alpha-galactosidase
MLTILKDPDSWYLTSDENQNPKEAQSGAILRWKEKSDGRTLFLRAKNCHPRLLILRWEIEIPVGSRILGDAWERAYGNLGWTGLNPERCLPWYFLLRHGRKVEGMGVQTRPNAMVSFSVDPNGITAYLDLRCGGLGVDLGNRELEVCTFLAHTYIGNSLEAARNFCALLSPDPILPKQPLYGGNNWYYAYGHSSFDEIIEDAALQAELAEGLENRPFMVIDDGWQPNPCAGPWIPNEKFKDMKKVADTFRNMGVRPGLWVRFLRDERPELPPTWRLNKNHLSLSDPALSRCTLDPSHPEVLAFIASDVRKFVLDWGYELIKHDFSEIDMFGAWGKDRNALITKGDWSFYDRKKTSAEITKNFYRTILNATEGKAIILGCNCIGHLLAGLAHANRTGDDTSGNDWCRTRKMGINTLAFRLPQHNTFFAADADCVGIIPGKIDPEMNREWATLLAYSGSPFFLSCARGSLPKDQIFFIKNLYRIASEGKSQLTVLDWEDCSIPSHYLLGGQEVNFDFYKGPDLSDERL